MTGISLLSSPVPRWCDCGMLTRLNEVEGETELEITDLHWQSWIRTQLDASPEHV
jgi:hypothetical protein